MAEYLFLVTIGPVQEFIAAARRTRDLWFGSWLLSDLSRSAAEAIQSNGGKVMLIFPPQSVVKDKTSTLANVANKILAQVSVSPDQVGTETVWAVKTRLAAIWKDAHIRFSGIIDDDAALAQITDLIEIYWAAVELPSEADYPQARRRVEALMAARKATRDFKPVTWGAMSPKSSIDGQRESVIVEGQYAPPSSTPGQRKAKAEELYRLYKAGPAERLSGVDLLKRHGRPSSKELYFPSTSDLAVRPLLAHLTGKERAKETWDTYVATVEYLAAGRLREERVNRSHQVIGDYDGGLLLESRLYELLDEHKDREDAHRALASFYSDLNLPRPEPYYAILLADGDRMGATIDHQQTIERHLELSRRLGVFAGKAKQLVEEHNGALIYAGGDDVLAFMPLHTLLDCGQALHDSFGTTINPQGDHAEAFTDKGGKRPTLSMGIAICHQIEPLSDALALAREAEKAAKGVTDKDALAIILSKRSGADVTISGKWGQIDLGLATFVTMHRIDTLPDGAAFQLRGLAERLMPKRGTPTLPAEATLSEAKRIIGRKQPKRGVVTKLALDTFSSLYSFLERLSLSSPSSPDDDPETASRKSALARERALAGVRALADTLIVAREFAVAADHAYGSLGKEA